MAGIASWIALARSALSVTRHHYDAAILERVLAEHLNEKNNNEWLLWTLLKVEI